MSVTPINGTPYQNLTRTKFDAPKAANYNQLMDSLQPYLQSSIAELGNRASGGTPEYWEANENQAKRQFGEFQGSTSSRYSGEGSGARRSSGFQNTMTRGSQDFAESLQAKRSEMQEAAIEQLLKYSSSLMGIDSSESQLIDKKKKKNKWWQNALGIGLPVAGAAVGGYLGGPVGASMGTEAGAKFGGYFME